MIIASLNSVSQNDPKAKQKSKSHSQNKKVKTNKADSAASVHKKPAELKKIPRNCPSCGLG